MNPTIVLWAGGALILILIAVGIIANISNRKSSEEERIGDYVATEQTEEAAKKERTTVVTDWLTKRVEKSSYGDKLAKELAQADLKLKPVLKTSLDVIPPLLIKKPISEGKFFTISINNDDTATPKSNLSCTVSKVNSSLLV